MTLSKSNTSGGQQGAFLNIQVGCVPAGQITVTAEIELLDGTLSRIVADIEVIISDVVEEE